MPYLLLAVAAAGLIRFSLVWNFVTDDAFISFVYAKNLAEHGELVFNLGERVEGYTNFLWTLILALGMKLGVSPESSSRVLGTAAAIGTFGVLLWLFMRLRADQKPTAWDAVPALFLAAVPGYACWSSGGLETQLFTFFVTLGGALYVVEGIDNRPPRWSALALGLAALTRPEGVLVFAVTVLHRGLRHAVHRLKVTSREVAWVAIFCALVVPHFVWRKLYYGWWLPNTFYIKSSAAGALLPQGFYYLWSATKQFHLWAPLVLLVAGLLRRRTRPMVVFVSWAVLVGLVYVGYVAKVGGDFMGLFRFIMPVIVLAYALGAVGLWLLVGDRGLVGVGVVVLLLVGHIVHAVPVTKDSLTIGADRGIDTPGFLRWYTADRAVIGKWFGQYRQPDDYMVVGGAGAQVYYSGIASLDAFGLSDEYIAHKVPPVGNRPGHQKYAPLDYQLKRKPTIITSNYYKLENHPFTPSPAEEREWRARGYEWVSVEMPGLSSKYYVFLKRRDRQLGPLPAAPAEPRDP